MNDQEFWGALELRETKPVLYRLYYDDQGLPLFYSQEDLPGNYIDLDHATYTNPPIHVRVVNNKLTVLNTTVVTKLHPGRSGTPCDPQDISVVVDQALPHIKWSLR